MKMKNQNVNRIKAASILLFSIITVLGNSQNNSVTSTIDSLKNILESSPTDSIYGEALTSLANRYIIDYPDSIDLSQKYAELGRDWGKKKNIPKVHGEGLDILGRIWRDKLDKEKSVANYQKAFDVFMLSGDTLSALKMRGNIATSLAVFGEVEEAINLKLQNIDAFAKRNDSTALLVEYYGVGFAYASLQDLSKAMPYYLKATNYGDHPLVFGTIGRSYATLGKLDSAYFYLEKGLAIVNQGTAFETDLLQKLGSVYFEDEKFDQSIVQYKKALNNIGINSEVDLANRIRTNLVNAYITAEMTNKARSLFNKVNYNEDNKVKVARYFELKYKLLELEGRHKDALEAHKSFKQARDSLTNTEVKSRVEEIETKYETKKKDIEIENMALQDELNKQVLRRQKKVLILTLSALGLISLLSFFLYRLYRKLRSQKEVIVKALSEKDLLLREIHHRVKNNLQLVSSLLTLQGRSIDDATALQAINEGKSRVRSMALIHQDLYNKENITGIGVKSYIEKLTQELFDTYQVDRGRITLRMDIEDIELDVDTLVPLGLIINELITNSLKYAFPEGSSGVLDVKLHVVDQKLVLSIADDGIGFDQAEIRDKSFGSTLVRALTEQLEGSINIQSEQGAFTKIVVENYN